MKKEELKKYVAEKYGEDFYPVYDEYTKKKFLQLMERKYKNV